MNVALNVTSDPPPLTQLDNGTWRITGTRIPLVRVVQAFSWGSTPEQIVQDYDVLALEDVYSVINFYLHHRVAINKYVAESEQRATEIRVEIESRYDSTGIRDRLSARRQNGSP